MPYPSLVGNSRRLAAPVVLALALTVTACSGGSTSSSGSSRNYVTGGTLTLAQSQDPGALDPQLTALSATRSVTRLAYDTLLNTDANGKLVSGLADKWTTTTTKVTFHLRAGITCSDGAPLTASDVAANFTFVGNPKNASPLIGIGAPAGVKATGDDATRTVTLTTATPTPFFLESTGTGLMIVCKKGTTDRKTLAHATDGTGMYVLSDSVPNDHYTFTRRPDYKWGPGGSSSSYPGVPEKIVVKIVANPATAMNLLLAKQVNIAAGGDAEAARAQSAGLESQGLEAAFGELWFNQAPGRPGADDAVRKALVGSLDIKQVGSVLTGGNGVPSTGLTTLEPRVCNGDTVTGNLPSMSLDAAGQLLDGAGWTMGANGVRSKAGKPLAFKFLVPSSLGTNGVPGSELLAATWKKLGATVQLSTPTDTALEQVLFGGGDWDAGFVPLSVNLPTQYAGFVSGPAPPDGTNFAHISNPTYEAAAKQAGGLVGAAACAKYEAGEKALIKDVNVAPLVNKESKFFANGADFRIDADGIVPQSLRLYK